MQAANRSATRRRFSTSRSASTPPLDDNSPPSNLATTDLPDTGDRPGSGSIGSFMAGGASWKWRGLASAPKPKPAQQLVPCPPGPHEFFGLSRPTLIRTRAQPVPDHALEPADGGLGPGARVVARGLLPAHPALLGDE